MAAFGVEYTNGAQVTTVGGSFALQLLPVLQHDPPASLTLGTDAGGNLTYLAMETRDGISQSVGTGTTTTTVCMQNT